VNQEGFFFDNLGMGFFKIISVTPAKSRINIHDKQAIAAYLFKHLNYLSLQEIHGNLESKLGKPLLFSSITKILRGLNTLERIEKKRDRDIIGNVVLAKYANSTMAELIRKIRRETGKDYSKDTIKNFALRFGLNEGVRALGLIIRFYEKMHPQFIQSFVLEETGCAYEIASIRKLGQRAGKSRAGSMKKTSEQLDTIIKEHYMVIPTVEMLQALIEKNTGRRYNLDYIIRLANNQGLQRIDRAKTAEEIALNLYGQDISKLDILNQIRTATGNKTYSWGGVKNIIQKHNQNPEHINTPIRRGRKDNDQDIIKQIISDRFGTDSKTWLQKQIQWAIDKLISWETIERVAQEANIPRSIPDDIESHVHAILRETYAFWPKHEILETLQKRTGKIYTEEQISDLATKASLPRLVMDLPSGETQPLVVWTPVKDLQLQVLWKKYADKGRILDRFKLDECAWPLIEDRLSFLQSVHEPIFTRIYTPTQTESNLDNQDSPEPLFLNILETDESEPSSDSESLDLSYKPQNAFQHYLNSLSKEPYLTIDEEISLAREYQAGSKSAGNKILENNLRFVISIAKEYPFQGRDVFNDLVSEGNLGLMRALQKYDPDLGYSFRTYANHWVRNFMTRYLYSEKGLPINITEGKSKIYNIETRFAQEHHRSPTDSEIATLANKSIVTIQRLRNFQHIKLSLDASNGEDERTFHDSLPEEDYLRPDQQYFKKSMRESVRKYVETLNPVEQKVLNLRFGLKDDVDHTLDEIGQILGVTRERIRQIESDALKLLKKRMDNQKTKPENYQSQPARKRKIMV
jgi:RNA polymerase sigma factor (sigma-70 family)